MIGVNGQPSELNDDKRDQVLNVISGFAQKALRTVAIAYRDYPINEFNAMKAEANNFNDVDDYEILESDLTLITIFGIRDALRPGVKEAIKACHNAGINVRMVTGDNIMTARIVAIDAGIITEADLADSEENQKYLCMEGFDFMRVIGGSVEFVQGNAQPVCKIEKMDEFRVVAKHLRVMARAVPEAKMILVDGL